MAKNITLNNYLNKLASSSPTPGGGSAASVAGAIAASLVMMVSALTIGKKGYESYDKKLKKIRNEASVLKNRFLKLSDCDIEAFNEVMKSYKIAKEEKGRNAEIQKALRYATVVPLETAEKANSVVSMAEFLTKNGNKNAYSDAKTAFYLAKAAKISALENVRINLKYINEASWKRSIEKRISQI